MPNYSELLADIAAAIYPNGQQEIDAVDLRGILNEIVYSLGAGFSFQGAATPDLDPGTPDNNVIYLAGPGTYTDFDGLVVPDGSLGILKYDGSWSLETIAGLGGGGGGGDFVQVTDTGLYFVDENLNIGAYLDATGFHAPNILEYQIVNL